MYTIVKGSLFPDTLPTWANADERRRFNTAATKGRIAAKVPGLRWNADSDALFVPLF
jgi:hypothetical protein